MSHDHAHAHANAHELDETPYHGSYRSYFTGFILSVILTAIPFAIVMMDLIETPVVNAIVLAGFAIAQVIVHMICFLHMNPKTEEGWNFLSFGFTLLLVVIAISGSVWVMHHLNTNMMPDHEMEATF